MSLSLLPRPIEHAQSHGDIPTTMLTVTVRIGLQHYGFRVDDVLEVVRLPSLLSLAGAPPTLCGLLNLRGCYVPVLNGRVLIGIPSLYTLSSQIVIVGHETPEFGVLVDQVSDVYALPIHRMSPIQRNTASAFLEGVINSSHGSVLLFNVAELQQIIDQQHPQLGYDQPLLPTDRTNGTHHEETSA